MEMNRENKRQEKFSHFEMSENLPFPDDLYDVELDLKIEKLMSGLEDQEREILFSNYFHNENMKAIASRMGLTEENCRVIKFRALRKMRKMVKDMNLIDAFN
jgi:RNA polymerase sigma factor (sigma-70 family)